MRGEVTYKRPIVASLHVHLGNGETFEAGPDDWEKFGLISRSDTSSVFWQRLAGIMLDAGLIERDKHLTDCRINPLRHFVDTVINYPTLLDHPDNRGWADVVELERSLRAGRDQRAIDALKRIDENGCIEMSVGDGELRCCDEGATDSDGVPVEPSEWCHPCVARHALQQMAES